MTATGRVSVSHDRTSQMSSPTSAEMRPTVLRIAIASGAANTWRRLSRPRRDEPLMAILFRREAGFRPLQLFDFHLDGGAPARQPQVEPTAQHDDGDDVEDGPDDLERHPAIVAEMQGLG